MGESFSGFVPTLAPLRTMAWGLLLVVVDLRVQGLDLVPDPIGWAVLLVGALRLVPLHRAFVVVAWASGVGLVASLPDWLGAQGTLLTMAFSVAETVLVFATCTAVMVLAPGHRRGADAIRWWDLGLTVAAVVLVAVARQEPDLAVLPVLVGVAALVVLVCFLVLLFRASRATPTGPGKTLQEIP